MQFNLIQIREGLAETDTFPNDWASTVSNGYSTLKSQLNVNDNYQFDIKLKNPLQKIEDWLATLILEFSRLVTEGFMNFLISTARNLQDLAQRLSEDLNRLRSTIEVSLGEIRTQFQNFTRDFPRLNFEVFSAISNAINDIVIAFGKFVSEVINNINIAFLDTIHALPKPEIDIPTFRLGNKIEIKILPDIH